MRFTQLLPVCAVAMLTLSLASCEQKSDVIDVCGNLIKETMHKSSARSLATLDGQKLTIAEYEFLGGVNDNRMVYRTIAFGNGVYEEKKVDTLTYEYGDWGPNNMSYSLFVTPATGDPYTLWYKGNAFLTPDGRSIGGEGTNCMPRVERWEKTLRTFPNTAWEATYKGEYVADSIFEDSVKVTFIPPATFKYDTIKVFKGKMDTLNADTTCYIRFSVKRDLTTLANTGHFYKKSIRTKYNRATGTADPVSEEVKEFDCTWYFSDISSDAKFVIMMESTDAAVDGEKLAISKYTATNGVPTSLLLGGLTYSPVIP